MRTRNEPPTDLRYVFGLELESSVPILGARPPAGRPRPPRAVLKEVSIREVERAWRLNGAVSIVELRSRAGQLHMSIDSHPELGFRISDRNSGKHLISQDGGEIRSTVPKIPAWSWQRFVFAQVLPLASALQGRAVFHASAVGVKDHALGFVAYSGGGKSSVAMHLVSLGADFVTDDVLALDTTADGVRAHPGPGMASIHGRELRAVNSRVDSRLGDVLGRSDKIHLAIPPVEQALPLGAIYYLRRYLSRGRRPDRFRIVETHRVDPRWLLSSTFIVYAKTPKSLIGHLDVCARMAQSVRVFEVRVPQSVNASEAAGEIAEHAGL